MSTTTHGVGGKKKKGKSKKKGSSNNGKKPKRHLRSDMKHLMATYVSIIKEKINKNKKDASPFKESYMVGNGSPTPTFPT